jgi:cytochrome oxidase assembly protein ShyY1
VPVIPTIAVAILVGIMIALGFWQLGRAHERDAAKERMIAHAQLPVIEYPYSNPLREDLLFRRLSATCTRVQSWETRGGEDLNGRSGWRHIATCVSPVGTVFKADMGVSASPEGQPAWQGGTIAGAAVRAPDISGMSDRIMHRQAPRALMVVAQAPAPGLIASRQPDPNEETNSSWAYTGQWFLFALTALVIYALALRKRSGERAPALK